MMDFANFLAVAQEGTQAAEAAEGVLPALWQLLCAMGSGLGSLLEDLGVGVGELSTGGVAVALAAICIFVRVIRMVSGILFCLCVVLLVLQLAGVVDMGAVLQTLGGWLSSEG